MLVASGRLLLLFLALDSFEHDAGSRWLGSRIEGSPHRGAREIAPATLYSVDLLDPDHDAHMRIGCEAPRRRAQSAQRHESHGFGGSPPPRTVIGSPLIERIAETEKKGAAQVGRITIPSGIIPSCTSRHKATRSLRARATIMVLRVRRAFFVRSWNHCARALSF
jgi:hypothetical protein